MASLKDIRRRIQSVKNTRQITRAMKLVAAAKLRRAQENILNARPYAYRIYSILLALAQQEETTHPLLVERPEKRARIIVLAGDRGMCGPFNSSILKATHQFLKQKRSQDIEVSIDCIGKRAFEAFKHDPMMGTHHEGLLGNASFTEVSKVAESVLKAYLEETFDSIYLVYNEFKSAIQQQVVLERLVPISTKVPDGVAGIRALEEDISLKQVIFEPSRETLLEEIVPRHFKTQLFRAVLESIASEHGSRMNAMENATNNASDLLDKLTLDYNKARQAGITKELMEIVGGVEAMR